MDVSRIPPRTSRRTRLGSAATLGVLGLVIGFAGAGLGPITPVVAGGGPTDAGTVNWSDRADPPARIPNGPDADGDGLSNAAERDLGTDPFERDTDGDGFPDGMEVACTDRLPAADPLRQDVYVEVDSTADAALTADVRSRLQYAFVTGPVENPIDDPGIALHFVDSDDDLPQAPVVGNRKGPGDHDDIADYRGAHFDHRDSGYYYLLVVSNASYRGDPSYAGAGYNGTALVEQQDRARAMATLVMHELGHAFGIGHGWRGVDDDRYSVAEYRSVMNYNGLYRLLSYAEGNGDLGRDEWAFVGEDRYRPPVACASVGCAASCRATPGA